MKTDKYNFTPYIDVLSEPSINLLRIYLIIKELQYNRTKRLVLSLEKLCFFNAAIVSDDIVESILKRHSKETTDLQHGRRLENFPYKCYGDLKEAIQGNKVREYIILLCNIGLINVDIIKDEKMLSTINEIEVNNKDPLIESWLNNIDRLRYCISKSDKELYSSLIEANYE